MEKSVGMPAYWNTGRSADIASSTFGVSGVA
jgi:hypothetical protein